MDGRKILKGYIKQYGKVGCGICHKPVLSSQGFHMGLNMQDETVSFTHWDCDKAYSDKIDAMLDDAHSDTGDGVVELGREAATKRKLDKNTTHYHIDDPIIAPKPHHHKEG